MLACAIALIMLIDVSGSVSSDNLALQRQGVIQALQDPQVQQIVLRQPGGMAVSVIEWHSNSRVIVPWHHVTNQNDFVLIVNELVRQPISSGMQTALGSALQHALEYFSQVPCVTDIKIIDVSGDGASNHGIEPQVVRDQAQQQFVTINGLPIITVLEPQLEKYYQAHVVTSDGFVMQAHSFGDFHLALRRKLIREIAHSSVINMP